MQWRLLAIVPLFNLGCHHHGVPPSNSEVVLAQPPFWDTLVPESYLDPEANITFSKLEASGEASNGTLLYVIRERGAPNLEGITVLCSSAPDGCTPAVSGNTRSTMQEVYTSQHIFLVYRLENGEQMRFVLPSGRNLLIRNPDTKKVRWTLSTMPWGEFFL
jgi:hypothetical protein